MVSEDKQIWHCFGCQKGGDIFSFVMEIEGLEFREALKLLAEKAGVEIKRSNPKLAAEKNKTLEILELAAKFYQAHLLQTAGGKKILDYLKERSINDGSIKEFRLGYAPDGWKNTLNFLAKKGFTDSEIAKTGLLVESQKNSAEKYYDRFRDRIMFPIADTNGKIVGFSARVAPGGDESQAKYVNTPETEVYHKSRILYGIDKAKQSIRQNKSVLLVEGNMDVIAAHQAGLQNTVAVSGTALTAEHLNIIKRYADKVNMCFDMDSAGEQATKKSAKLCFEKDINAGIVELPFGKDAAELAQNDPEALKEAVGKASSAMEYFFAKSFSKHDKKKIEDKKIITEELLEIISYLSNNIEKNHWLKKIGAELDIQESVLTDMLKKASLKYRVNKTSESSEPTDGNFSPKSKLETLLENLIGLMLIYSGVWKKIAEGNHDFLPKDSLLNAMVRLGEEFHFSFDELINNPDLAEQTAKAERIYFEKRYRIGLDNKLEEISLAEPEKEAEKYLQEIKKELKKEELNRITKDLKTAEENQDKEALPFLRAESKKILEDISYLDQ